MASSKIAPLSIVAPALALVLAARLAGGPPPAPAESFGEVVDVRIVNVDVYVTDRQGQPISGLRAADFELYEDGRRIELANFDVLTEVQAPVPAPPAAAPAEAPPGAPAEAPVALPAPAITIGLYFDDEHLRPVSRQRALGQLRDFLARGIHPQDRVVIFTTGAAGAAPPPADARPATELPALLGGLGRDTGAGVRRDLDWRTTVETMRHIFDTVGCGHDLETVARSYSGQAEADARAALGQLEEAVRKLGALAGEKALFFISEGVPARPGEELSWLIAEWCNGAPPMPERDLASRLRTVGAIANARRVTLYTIEAGGAKGTTGASVQFGQNILSFAIDRARIGSLQDSLTALAAETGGLAVLNANDISPDLSRVASALRNHYSLAFAPRGKPDGKEHRIKVKVARRGVELRYRQSYRG